MDSLGNLAVSNDANNSIAIFRARQLKGSGAVNPGTFLIVPLPPSRRLRASSTDPTSGPRPKGSRGRF
jgi:hypothetical protein